LFLSKYGGFLGLVGKKSYFFHTYLYMTKTKRDKNLKIDSKTHSLLKNYCEKKGLKMFAFVERLIKETCSNVVSSKKDDLYGD